MNQNWSEQIMSVVNQLAEKLGVATEKLYPMLLKQLKYNCVMDIIFIILSIGIIVYTAYMFKKVIKNIKESHDDTGWILIGVLFVILDISSVITLISCITELIQIKMNPDYYVFDMIMRLVSK